jgi:hypothetical protein
MRLPPTSQGYPILPVTVATAIPLRWLFTVGLSFGDSAQIWASDFPLCAAVLSAFHFVSLHTFFGRHQVALQLLNPLTVWIHGIH